MDKDNLSVLDGPDDLQRASVCGSSAPARIETDSIAGLQRQLSTKFLTKNLRCLRGLVRVVPSRALSTGSRTHSSLYSATFGGWSVSSRRAPYPRVRGLTRG